MMHIGDEAMFEQFLDQSRLRGASDVVAISANPDETVSRYAVEAVPRLGLTGDRTALLERAHRILTGDLPVDDPAHATLEAVASADRVVVTGAGNLASTWPQHIVERWTLSRLAAARGIPFIVTGQTLGPALTPHDSALLTEMLDSAALVGVREPSSLALATRLGIDAVQTIDDASFLAIERPSPPELTAPYCLVTLSTHVGSSERGAFQTRVAAYLDEIVAATGLEIVFFAHFGPLAGDPHRGDVVMHEAVRALMTSPSSVVPTGDSTSAAWLSRRASLAVSSRYHPAVFAVAAGVPTIGISVDDYTGVKLRGALGNFGQTTVFTIDELGSPAEVWGERAGIRSRSIELADARRPESSRWWDRVVAP